MGGVSRSIDDGDVSCPTDAGRGCYLNHTWETHRVRQLNRMCSYLIIGHRLDPWRVERIVILRRVVGVWRRGGLSVGGWVQGARGRTLVVVGVRGDTNRG